MTSQKTSEESNWQHEPKTEHYVADKFGKGTNTRNWKKNLDETLNAGQEDSDKETSENDETDDDQDKDQV